MQVIYGLEQVDESGKPTAMTIGNFDGLHVGHQKIIRRVVALAEQAQVTSTVMTFEYHPLRLLDPPRAPQLLMPLAAKLAAIEALAVERTVVVRCTRQLLGLSPEQFVREVLLRYFQIRFIVEGPSFRFGHRRAGTIDFLVNRGPQFRFEAIKIDPVRLNLLGREAVTISSSLIRRLMSEGAVDLVDRCLGRPYELAGGVVPGAGRGRPMGFPTANLEVGEQMVPADGIYAAWTTIEERDYPAAVHVGPVPTFGRSDVSVEAHLIDFDGELYGRQLTLKLVKRLRGLIKFDRASDLADQMRKDVAQVKEVFAATRRAP